MTPRRWIGIGALWTGLAVLLGAFGAHGLEERLGPERLADWETAVRYHAWHGIALVLFGLFQKSWAIRDLAAWSFLGGSVCFSGSIYALSLGVPSAGIWWITPLGGSLLVVGWIALAWRALRG